MKEQKRILKTHAVRMRPIEKVVQGSLIFCAGFPPPISFCSVSDFIFIL